MRRGGALLVAAALALSSSAGCNACTNVGELEFNREPSSSSTGAGVDPTVAWTHQYGDVGEDFPASVLVDAEGNVVLAGTYEGSIDFGGGEPLVTTSQGRDAFVVKLLPDGSHVFSQRFGDTGDDCALRAALAPGGNIVALLGKGGDGSCLSSIEASDPSFGTGLTSFLLQVLEPGGTAIASTPICAACDPNAVGPRALAVDAGGDMYVGGSFAGTLALGNPPLTAIGSQDPFVARLAASGAVTWSASFPGAPGGNANVTDLAIDPSSGALVVVGLFDLDLTIGSTTLAGALYDVFVAKLGAGGAPLWSKQLVNAWYLAAPRVALDAAGNVYVSGDFLGDVDFGGATLSSGGVEDGVGDGYVVKLDPSGGYQWSQRIGQPQSPVPDDSAATALAVDAAGGVVVTGPFTGRLALGDQVHEAEGFASGTYLVRFDAAGGVVSSKVFLGADDAYQADEVVAIDPSDGHVVVAGTFSGIADFGRGPVESVDMDNLLNDVFVLEVALP